MMLIRLTNRRTTRDPKMNTKVEWIKVLAFHGQVILAMVLLIIGITQQISQKTNKANTLAKVGVVMLLLCEAVFIVWVIFSFNQKQRTELPAWYDATLVRSPSIPASNDLDPS